MLEGANFSQILKAEPPQQSATDRPHILLQTLRTTGKLAAARDLRGGGRFQIHKMIKVAFHPLILLLDNLEYETNSSSTSQYLYNIQTPQAAGSYY